MAALNAILEKCAVHPPNILATLQAVQEEYGWVDPDHVPLIAKALGVTDSDVRGVLSFYHDLRTEKPGRHVVKVCLGDSCIAVGAGKCLDALEKKLKVGVGETTRDGKFSLDKVYCLGACALSPAMMVDGEVHARLTPRNAAAPLKGCR